MRNAVVPRTSDDEGDVCSPLNTSGVSNFLFINETSDAPSYKQGTRRDVRSHVQKRNQRKFKETHKTARKRALARLKYAPLATRSLESDATCYLEHSRDYPSPETRLRLFIRDSGSMFEDLAPIELNESPSSTNSSPTVTKTPDPSELQGDFTKYCKPLSTPNFKQRYLSKDGSLIQGGSIWKILLKPNPVEVLGAGRIDPFSCLPMDEANHCTRELMDHAVTCFLPGLMPDQSAFGEINPLSKTWFKSALQTSLLFQALIYVGSNHLNFMRWSNTFPNAAKSLYHKLIVIQMLNQALSDPLQATRDETILVILILASEVFISKKGNSSPFNPPFKSLMWLNMYGTTKFVPQHAKAVADILKIKGGLETIKLIGLAGIIVGGDVISATNSITKPGFPTLQIHKASVANLKAWAISPPRPAIQTQASKFQSLKEYGITESMLQVLDLIGSFNLAADHYLQGKPFGFKLSAIATARNAVQHRLLLLQTAEELSIPSPSLEPKPNIYECCRLTALIYGVGVVLPVPNSHNVLQKLSRHLIIEIRVLDIRTFGAE